MEQHKIIDFSLIIPTYNRPDYLKRVLSYYDKYSDDKNFKIIIADSSENKAQNKEIIKQYPDLDIQHLSDYPIEIHPNHKIFDALDYIKSKYCVICADDDFITPTGIKQSVDFLENNSDFTIAHGQYISFQLKNDKRKKQQFYWTPLYLYESITFPDAKYRLTEHFSNYSVPTFYGVYKTNFLKMIFEETLSFTNDGQFGELLPSMLTLIYGKMKCLDVLFAARDGGSVQMNTDPKYFYRFKDFIKAGTYDEKYAKFRECLALHLSKMSQLEVEESTKVVDNAISAYMAKYPEDYKHIVIHKMKKELDNLGLPDWIDKGIRAPYRKIFLPKQKDSFLNLKSSIETPSSKYYDDFNKIRLHVLAHSIQRSDEKRKFS